MDDSALPGSGGAAAKDASVSVEKIRAAMERATETTMQQSEEIDRRYEQIQEEKFTPNRELFIPRRYLLGSLILFVALFIATILLYACSLMQSSPRDIPETVFDFAMLVVLPLSALLIGYNVGLHSGRVLK